MQPQILTASIERCKPYSQYLLPEPGESHPLALLLLYDCAPYPWVPWSSCDRLDGDSMPASWR